MPYNNFMLNEDVEFYGGGICHMINCVCKLEQSFLDDDLLDYVNEELDGDLAPKRKQFKLAANTHKEIQELARGIYKEGVEIKDKTFSIGDIE
jgi:hypothetical protein